MLSGGVHMVTQVSPGSPCVAFLPCNIYINLADMHGVGVRSGRRCVAVGADLLTPVEPITPVDPIRAEFVTMPVSHPTDSVIPGNPLMPITVEIRGLLFDDAGHLIPESIKITVRGGECGDACIPWE